MKDLTPFTVVYAKNMLFKLAVIGALFLAIMLIPICIYQLAGDRFAQTLASTKTLLMLRSGWNTTQCSSFKQKHIPKTQMQHRFPYFSYYKKKEDRFFLARECLFFFALILNQVVPYMYKVDHFYHVNFALRYERKLA